MYYNFIVMSHFNIDVNLPSHEHEKLEEFWNFLNFSNLIKSDTYFTKTHSSKINLNLENNSNSFLKQPPEKRVLATFINSLVHSSNHTFLDLAQKLYTTEITETLRNQNLLKI